MKPRGIPVAALEGALEQKILSPRTTRLQAPAPGRRASHYAPATPLEIHSVDALWRRALQLAWQGYKVAVLKLGDDGECFDSRGITSFYMGPL